MAGRIRTIKPETLSDSKAARLSDRAWRLWVSMWTLADDAGLAPADVDYLSAQVFWGTKDKSAHEARVELVNAGFISLYEISGEVYAKINGWKKHQKIDKPSGARFPIPPDDLDLIRESSRILANVREPSARDHDLDHDHEGTTTILPHPPPASGGESFDFDAVYDLYPRKLGRKKGLQRCRSQIKTREKYDALLRAVKNYAAHADPAYTKHFDTFMGCWEDYVDAGNLTPRQSRSTTAIPPRDAVEEDTTGCL